MYDGAGLMKESVSERGGLKQWAEMAREKSIPIIVTETLDGEQMGSLPEGTSLLARHHLAGQGGVERHNKGGVVQLRMSGRHAFGVGLVREWGVQW